MVNWPWAEGLELAVDAVAEGFEFNGKVAFKISSRTIQLAEEDKANVIFQVKVNLRIILLDSLQLQNELLNKQWQRQLHLQGSLILLRKMYDSVFLHLHDFLNDLGNLNDSGEEDKLFQLGNEALNDFNLGFQSGIAVFEFS